LFGVPVPVKAHRLADPEKGTGIAMICTFGDTTDVTWWRELDLPVRAVVGRNGRLLPDAPDEFTYEATDLYQSELAGKTLFSAKERIVELLGEAGALRGEPRPITHPVKFYEKGDKPLEIVTSRQWYIRNGGREDDLRQALIGRGKELDWHPGYMRARYEDWIEGLNGDWLISRQRYFGVPIPVWYGVGADGEVDHDTVLVPDEDALPVDPSSEVPPGYDEDQRSQPGGFVGEADIMDTWATSSLTPQIVGGWVDDEDLFQRVFPMDLRPQGHDIIRTWLFATMTRSHHEFGCAPWSHAALSGWILDPDRKKMSKSKGNVVTPLDLFETYGTDAVRYWSGSGRPGVDTAYSEDQMKVGRKLANKLLNVTKFVLQFGAPTGDRSLDEGVTDLIDRSMLAKLDEVIAEATEAFDAFDYARALERTEAFFWWFCDNYVELVKGRTYDEARPDAADSAKRALRAALSTVQRLFAPVLPFASEEAWSWWNESSIHVAPWPTRTAGTDEAFGDPTLIDATIDVLTQVRRAKTEAKRSQRAVVDTLVVTAPAGLHAALDSGRADLLDAGSIRSLTVLDGVALAVEVTLADEP
jgi:valyl-tRNA synthetase